ncbi:MAG: GatB/YqeY domain-containing protein [Deltaproteobacteria bacterium]|nr:GatB/YqeY domain-containing protein [Deltaproteobacteria bacterium]
MPSIKERISGDMKAAMKSGDKASLGAIRMLHAAIRKKEIDDRIDLDDAGAIKIITSLVKQRQDSIEQFTAGNRMDLVEKETAEMKLLQAYLPAQMSQDELVKIIDASIQEADAKTQKDMGKLMKVLMPKVSGKADGKLVNQLVRERLPAA